MPKKILILFLSWFCLMFLIGILMQPETRENPLDTISFRMPQPAEIYFKNVRSYYYYKTEEGAGTFEAYRIRSKDTNSTKLQFTIYIQKKAKMAYIRAGYSQDYDPDKLFVTYPNNNTSDTIFWPDPTNESQFIFAREVYFHLQNENASFEISSPEGRKHVLKGNQRYSVKKTLFDFFRLVNKV